MFSVLQKNLSCSEAVVRGLSQDVVEAACSQTYVETVSSRADSFHRALKCSSVGEWSDAFCEFMRSKLGSFGSEKIWLACDLTEEDYYGQPTLMTHPWTGEFGIRAHWKFAVISLISSSMKRTVPLACLPFYLGQSLAATLDCLIDSAAASLPRIDGILLDRGFYSGAVIEALSRRDLRYVMLVPKNGFLSGVAEQCQMANEWCVLDHSIEWKEHKTTNRVPTQIVVFADEKWTWLFATNIAPYQVRILRWLYKKRWRIETMFRVQDESRIKTKSTRSIVRYVIFLLSLLLTAIWSLGTRITSFKRWMIETVREFWTTRTAPLLTKRL